LAPFAAFGLHSPAEGQSLRSTQDDRLTKTHDANERPNIRIALPNRPAKERLGMGVWGKIL